MGSIEKFDEGFAQKDVLRLYFETAASCRTVLIKVVVARVRVRSLR
jgi:hypothetical protein